jgi:hypothetical protein
MRDNSEARSNFYDDLATPQRVIKIVAVAAVLQNYSGHNERRFGKIGLPCFPGREVLLCSTVLTIHRSLNVLVQKADPP